MNLQLLDHEDNLLAEVKDLQNRILDVCTKLGYKWDHACKRADRLEVPFPAITGNLEVDSAIAFIVATQPGNPKFVGMHANTEGYEVLPVTKENYARFAVGEIIVYNFSRDKNSQKPVENNDETLQYLTTKQAEWIDTPPFSGMVFRKELDENGLERLTLCSDE